MLNRLLVTLIGLCLTGTASAINFYVSPTGSDQANGLFAARGSGQNGPFKTLGKAQQASLAIAQNPARQEAINIYIAPGTYYLAAPLNFTNWNADATGKPLKKNPITWINQKSPANSDNEANKVIISGGFPLTGCAPETNSVWSCSTAGLLLPETQYEGLAPGFNLYVDDQRMQVARWPNSDAMQDNYDDWAHVQTTDGVSTITPFEKLPGNIQNSELADAQLVGYTQAPYYRDIYALDSVSIGKNQVKVIPKTNVGIYQGTNFYLQNLKSQMDAPGEWIANKAKATIEFIPPDGASPSNIVMSATYNLVVIKNSNYINFKGLTFRHSIGSAVQVDTSQFLTLDHLEFNNLDANNTDPYKRYRNNYAIVAINAHNFTLSNSHLYDLLGGGANITALAGDYTNLTPSGNVISNNHIQNIETGVIVKGVATQVTNNTIENVVGHGIEYSGNDNWVAYNEVSNACRLLGDCGAIYAGRSWADRGNVIAYNYIHDIQGHTFKNTYDTTTGLPQYGSRLNRGIYLDDGLSGIKIYGNQLANIADAAILVFGGRDNDIENNYIASSSTAINIQSFMPQKVINPDSNQWWMVQTLMNTVRPYYASQPGDPLPHHAANPVWQKRYPEMWRRNLLASPQVAANAINHWPEYSIVKNNVIRKTSTDMDNVLTVTYDIPATNTTISNNIGWAIADTNQSKTLLFGLGYYFVDYDAQTNKLPLRGWFPSFSKWVTTGGIEKNSFQTDCVRFPNAALKQTTATSCDGKNAIAFNPLPSLQSIGVPGAASW